MSQADFLFLRSLNAIRVTLAYMRTITPWRSKRAADWHDLVAASPVLEHKLDSESVDLLPVPGGFPGYMTRILPGLAGRGMRPGEIWNVTAQENGGTYVRRPAMAFGGRARGQETAEEEIPTLILGVKNES